MITDTEARKIASEWHGGGGTALYAFSSTGAINTARADHDLIAEILDAHRPIKQARTTDEFEQFKQLERLAFYVDDKGTRGPVEGWSKLTW